MIRLGRIVISVAQPAPRRNMWKPDLKRKILDRQVHQCLFCGKRTPALDIHHVCRRRNGGPDDPSNLVAICMNCHGIVNHSYGLSPASRVILISQLVAPESVLVSFGCRLLFRMFLRSRIDQHRYQGLGLGMPRVRTEGEVAC